MGEYVIVKAVALYTLRKGVSVRLRSQLSYDTPWLTSFTLEM